MRTEYLETKKEADRVSKELFPFCDKLEICGSVRRRKDTNGDIDIVVVINDEKGFNNKVGELGFLVLPTMTIKRFDIPVSIYFTDINRFGAMILHFTGSNPFNEMMREKAISMGMILCQFGLYKNGKCISSKDERDIFSKLEMDFVNPIDRNN